MNTKIRLIRLGKKQVDLIDELHKMGYPEVASSTLSTALSGRSQEPKMRLIKRLCDEILTKWESEV